MEKNKENLPLIIVAVILTVIVIACIIGAICMNTVSVDQKGEKPKENLEQSNINNDDKTTDEKKDENEENEEDVQSKPEEKEVDDEIEEVKKINENEGLIFENIVQLENGNTLKVPKINLTTKYAKKVNEEVEKIYKDKSSKSYTIYSYYMYVGTVTLILDNVKDNTHFYNVYNVNTKTGKQLTYQEILNKVDMSEEEFIKKLDVACKSKFEEIYKDKNSTGYKTALDKTLEEAKNIKEILMYITHEGKVECVVKIYNPVNNLSSEYIIKV